MSAADLTTALAWANHELNRWRYAWIHGSIDTRDNARKWIVFWSDVVGRLVCLDATMSQFFPNRVRAGAQQ